MHRCHGFFACPVKTGCAARQDMFGARDNSAQKMGSEGARPFLPEEGARSGEGAVLSKRHPALLHEQPINGEDVARREPSRCLTQPQGAQQHVVPRACEVALGLVQLALRVEHVDVDADADAVAELRGLERAEIGRASCRERV